MNDETKNDEMKASDVEAGPKESDLPAPAQGDGTASRDADAGDGANVDDGDSVVDDGEPMTRVRMERFDGDGKRERFWHTEQTDDAELAERLANGRGIGTVVRVEENDDEETD